ncbi:MAG: hypothetical protein K0U33_00520 [Bacteroidetes bacterium]|nr:hypothetical protein [Bacteroidota bacterium]
MIFRLKSLIVLKFGRPIEKRSDCEALALDIEIAVGHNLGYNTLRRFFGLDNHKVETRLSTLDIFSNYVGYNSYQHFTSDVNFSLKRNNKVKLYELLSTKDPVKISLFIKQTFHLRDQYLEFIIDTARFFLASNDVLLLISVFNQLELETKELTFAEKLYVGNSIGIIFRSTRLYKYQLIKLFKSPFMNDIVFESFVDYSSLNGFYGQFIKERHLANPAQRYFKNALRVLHDYLNKKETVTPIDSDINDTMIHPVLKGRLFSLPLYQHNSSIESIMSCKVHFSPAFFYEIMVASIITSNFYHFNDINREFSKFLKLIDEYWLNYLCVYQIFQAAFYYKNGNIIKTKELMSDINLDSFRLSYKSFLSFFYYLLDWKVNSDNTSKTKAIHLSQKFNYSLFNKDFFENY